MAFLFGKLKNTNTRVSSFQTTQDKFYEEKVIFDQKFGLEILPFQMKEFEAISQLYGNDEDFPWRRFLKKSKMKVHGKEFDTVIALHVDIHHFKDWEIDVNIEGLYCIVTGIHGPRKDEHGTTLRKYERKIKFPENVVQKSIKYQISKDGILTVSAEIDLNKVQDSDVLVVEEHGSDLYGVEGEEGQKAVLVKTDNNNDDDDHDDHDDGDDDTSNTKPNSPEKVDTEESPKNTEIKKTEAKKTEIKNSGNMLANVFRLTTNKVWQKLGFKKRTTE